MKRFDFTVRQIELAALANLKERVAPFNPRVRAILRREFRQAIRLARKTGGK